MNTLRTNVLISLARRYACAAAIAFAAFTALTLPCNAQRSASTNSGSQLPRRIPPPQEADQQPLDSLGPTPMFYEKRLKMLNAAQHQSMVADTDRLLKLVADLNAQINASNSSALTPEQVRMVAEIEKLAHSIRDKMRMSVRSAVEYNVPTSASPYGQR